MNSDFLCFDTESAQGRYQGRYIEELLEISIMDGWGHTLYYSRFKPARLTKWDTKIHHIKPSMVDSEPKFAECHDRVAEIFDRARYIVGFSLVDDFKAMSKVGIDNLDKKKVIELRHIYWYCIARHKGVAFYSGPGLSVCAQELGVTVVDEAVHTASGDTRVTLGLFFALMRKFAEQEGVDFPDTDTEEFIRLIDLLFVRLKEAKYEYDSKVASGYMHVVSHEDGGYRFVPSVKATRDENDAILTIPVNARRRAAFELEKAYSKRRIQNTKNFNLTEGDIEEIAGYTNEFDNQEQMYEKLLGVQRAMASPPKRKKGRGI